MKILKKEVMKIGSEISMQFRCEIPWLKVAKEITNLFTPSCFKHTLFCDSFCSKATLGINNSNYAQMLIWMILGIGSFLNHGVALH